MLPYLIANCQTQSYVEVVRDKMLRIQLQEREKSFTTQLRTSARVVPVRGRTIVMQKVEESKVGEETSTVLVKNDGEPGASSSLLPRSPRIGTVTARSAGHNASAQLSPDIFTGSPLEARRVVERRGESGAKRKRTNPHREDSRAPGTRETRRRSPPGPTKGVRARTRPSLRSSSRAR